MADNPFQGMLNPQMNRGANLWDLRMMSSANRMEQPFERMAGRGMYGHQGVGGNPMLASLQGMQGEPDLSQFTYDPALRAQAQQAGVQPLDPSQVRHNAFLPETGFFGNHPNLSAAIERGAFGALAAHGGATIGDSIQGTLEGMIGGPRIRQGILNQQFARPFESANIMENLHDKVQKRELQSADIEHLRALNEHIKNGDDYKVQQLTETNRHQEAMEAIGWQKAETSRALLPEHNMQLETRQQLMNLGIDPNKATREQIQSADQAAEQRQIRIAGAKTGAGKAAGEPYQKADEARRDFYARQRGYQGKLLKSDDPSHVKQIQDQHAADISERALKGEQIPPGEMGPLTDAQVRAQIKTHNDSIQEDQRADKAAFINQWGDDALQAPTTPEGRSSRRTGSSRKTLGTADNPHVIP